MDKLTETINVRISRSTREWLEANFSAHGDISWIIRTLLESLKAHWTGKEPLEDAVRKAVEELW